jgi:hypothetical protein
MIRIGISRTLTLGTSGGRIRRGRIGFRKEQNLISFFCQRKMFSCLSPVRDMLTHTQPPTKRIPRGRRLWEDRGTSDCLRGIKFRGCGGSAGFTCFLLTDNKKSKLHSQRS